MASLVIDRLKALVKWPVEVLLAGNAPGLKMSRCLLLTPPMAWAMLSGVMGRAMKPCRPLTRALPPSGSVDDVSMTGDGGDGETPVPAGDGTPLDAPMPDGSGAVTPPGAPMPDGSGDATPATPPCPMGPVVLAALLLSRRPCVLHPRLVGVRAGRGRSRVSVAPGRGARTVGSRLSSCIRATRRPAAIASRSSKG